MPFLDSKSKAWDFFTDDEIDGSGFAKQQVARSLA
jgi:hypothetical protein